MKALDILHDISRRLKLHNIDSPDNDAEIILKSILDLRLSDIYRNNPELSSDQLSGVEQIISRRSRHEPLQYIIGHVDFMGLKVLVGKGALIPRPETELMAEIAVKGVKGQGSRVKGFQNFPLRILDLCTGSGCLALALAKEFPDAEVYGIDISDAALSYAKKNGELNGISNVSFIRGNLLEALKNPPESPFPKGGSISPSLKKRGKGRFFEQNFFDLIISNPPYITSEDIKNLQPEIKEWEPLNALDGGAEGLDYYRKIIPAARAFLKENGILMMELGVGCADAVRAMLRESGYSDIELIKDYAGIERIAVGKRGGS